MKKAGLWLIAMVLMIPIVQAQTRFLVRFKDKNATPFSLSNPSAYLSQKAIDRRNRYHIAMDSTDLPVSSAYMDSIKSIADITILNISKWLNQVSVQTTDSTAITKINRFHFVLSVTPIATRTGLRQKNKSPEDIYPLLSGTFKQQQTVSDYYSYGNSFNQVHIHNGDFLHNIGLRGQDMNIGMLDAGFYRYTSLKAFDSVNANNQILDTWDFVHNEENVINDDTHGMECFSIMAANMPNTFVGTAPKANFYLYVTEDVPTEYPIEEHNWVCGAERVDSAGGDIISTSLGYTTFDNPDYNHTYADMNGHTTMAAKGADLAAKKGILVLASAGNDGNKPWHYISTPADGDSVLAVGAVDISGQVAAFSSYGPSADGQVKPDVASVGAGTIFQHPANTISSGSGTSFACPNMAGLAACLWQGFREFSNIKIINALRQSGSIYTTPNDRIGYGIPDVKKALTALLNEYATASATVTNCAADISWSSKDMSAMQYIIERKTATDTAYIKIAEQRGTGNIFANYTYQFIDSLKGTKAGTIIYRIRQIVDTAAASFTAFDMGDIAITLNSNCYYAGDNFTIAPNPAHNQIKLIVAIPEAMSNMQIRITNIAGQTVQMLNKIKPAETATFDIPISYLAAGKYFVSVYNNGHLIGTKQMLKL